MTEEVSLSFIINNGVAIGVAWYVLTRLNKTLQQLTDVINNFNKDTNKRLDAIESNEHQTQMQIHELKVQIDSIRHGDN